MSIQVDPIVSPRIITVPEVDGNSITVQTLVDQIRDWEQTPINLGYKKLLSASGKEDLGDEVYVGITAKLENAKLKFEERASATVCAVSGGNLVAVDATGGSMDVIEPSTNVTVMIAQSTSASLIAGGSGADPEVIADAVWDAAPDDIGTPPETIATAVWDSAPDDIGTPPHSIADAIWNTVIDDHDTPGTIGGELKSLADLNRFRYTKRKYRNASSSILSFGEGKYCLPPGKTLYLTGLQISEMGLEELIELGQLVVVS